MATTKITNPELFDLASLDSALQLPSGTTAERPTSPSTGEWRYNTDDNAIEFYDGSFWLTIQDEDIPPVPSENFNTVLYTGNGTSQSITGVGFKPDWIWIKERTSTSNNVTFDSTRGIYEQLYITTDPESNNTATVSSFDSDGFSVGNGLAVNESGQDYVAWCWKANGGTTSSNTDGTITSTVQANRQAGFSIIKYTGNGSASATVGHGLGSIPELTIFKQLDSGGTGGGVWNTYLTSNNTVGFLNSDIAFVANTGGTNGSVDIANMSSTTFGFLNGSSSANNQNNSGSDYIVYAFTSIPTYSKIGTYTGTGSTSNRPIINTGFEPAYVMIKNTTTADDWMIHDNKRNPSNPRDRYLRANSNFQEGQFAEFGLDFLTNGFQVGPTTNNNWNGSGQTYIYIAFAADPSTAPVLADSFNTNLYTGNGTSKTVTGLGFSPSLVWIKQRDAIRNQNWYDVLRGPNNIIFSNSTAAQDTTSTEVLQSFDTDGFTLGNLSAVNASGGDYVSWNWKGNALPTINTDGSNTNVIVSANQAAGFSVIKWTGDGVNNATIGHGLSGTPELLIMKTLSVLDNWRATSTYLANANGYLFFNTNGAETTTLSGDGSITRDGLGATTFTCTAGSSTSNNTNKLNDQYIAYAFKSIAGFSKIGTYTGTGGTSNSITGLGFQPSWVLIKDITTAKTWFTYDSERTVSVGSNPGTPNARPYLLPASSGAENGATAYNVNLDSDGFTVPASNIELNGSGDTYIYMAFKENPAQPAIPSGEMEYLVAAGGGGSASDSGGGPGGGAGGLRTSYGDVSGGGASAETAITLATGTYTITIGAGGAAFVGGVSTAQNGVASSISGTATVNTVGGGGAGDPLTTPTIYLGKDGGSGGGSGNGNANYSRPTGGAGTTGEGFAGGGARDYAVNDDRNAAGGGGGSGGVGITAQSYIGGDGGFGLTSAITGKNISYAGGGGGGCRGNTASNVAGQGFGGGGNATNTGAGNPGTANTGGGAGGGRSAGANGGSGVVILRMNTSDYSGTTTGSPTVTTVGSETILTFTGSGTYVHS